MRLGPGKDRRLLAQTFREIREILGLPQPAYARLFGVERALVQELEEGHLPAALDERLLKFVLLGLTMQRKPEFISTMMREINNYYGVDHIFEQKFPVFALFEHVLGAGMARLPWIAESVVFRSKAIRHRRIGNLLLLWGEHRDVHEATLKAFAKQTPAFINFINGRTLILMPALYLFLDLDTSQSTNPIVKELETSLEKREPICLALPRKLPSSEQFSTTGRIDLSDLRLFAYSQDIGMLREAGTT